MRGRLLSWIAGHIIQHDVTSNLSHPVVQNGHRPIMAQIERHLDKMINDLVTNCHKRYDGRVDSWLVG